MIEEELKKLAEDELSYAVYLRLKDERMAAEDYGVIAKIRGHEILHYAKYGSYQGEWLLISYFADRFYIWKGYYGSCSGCDSLEAAGLREESTIDNVVDFCRDYFPFAVLDKSVAKSLYEKGQLKSIFPLNIAYDDRDADIANAIFALEPKIK